MVTQIAARPDSAAADISIETPVIGPFRRLREALSLSHLFISHDVGVVKPIPDRSVIMSLGRAAETPSTRKTFARRPTMRPARRNIAVAGAA